MATTPKGEEWPVYITRAKSKALKLRLKPESPKSTQEKLDEVTEYVPVPDPYSSDEELMEGWQQLHAKRPREPTPIPSECIKRKRFVQTPTPLHFENQSAAAAAAPPPPDVVKAATILVPESPEKQPVAERYAFRVFTYSNVKCIAGAMLRELGRKSKGGLPFGLYTKRYYEFVDEMIDKGMTSVSETDEEEMGVPFL